MSRTLFKGIDTTVPLGQSSLKKRPLPNSPSLDMTVGAEIFACFFKSIRSVEAALRGLEAQGLQCCECPTWSTGLGNFIRRVITAKGQIHQDVPVKIRYLYHRDTVTYSSAITF